MRRRSHGDGGITVRKDGRAQASFTGSDGKRHYLYAKTRKAVADRLRKAIEAKESGLYVTGSSQTVEHFLTRWLERADHLRPITRKRYEALIRLHALPHLGRLDIRKVRPDHVAELYQSLKGERKPATIGQLHAVLHSAFAEALRWNLIARNPVAAVRAPKVERVEMRILSNPEIYRFLAAVQGDPLEALYVLAVTMGPRQGELLALRWQDVDLEAGTISINATLTRINGVWHRSPPKTSASVRVVTVPPDALPRLKAHRVRMAEELLPMRGRTEGEQLVFLHRGRAVNGFHLTERQFKPLLRRSELPDIRFHDLRHTAVSWMLSHGIPVHVVAKIVGHSNPAITMSRYAHVIPSDIEVATAVMNQMLEVAG
jgi:integrase